MLQDQYTIVGKNGKTREHYEFRIARNKVEAAAKEEHPGLSCAGGIRLVEEYVSCVLGKKYILTVIRESRFFPMEPLPEGGLVLDLSVSPEPDHYRIIAEIAGSNGVLLEISGMVAEAAAEMAAQKECSVA